MTNIFRRIKRHIGVEIESVSIEKCSANSFFLFLLCFKWVFLNRYFICLLLIFQIVHRAKNEYVSLAFFQGHSVPMVKVRNNNIYIPISIVLTFYIIASNNFERSFAVRHLGSLQQTRGKIHVLKKINTHPVEAEKLLNFSVWFDIQWSTELRNEFFEYELIISKGTSCRGIKQNDSVCALL